MPGCWMMYLDARHRMDDSWMLNDVPGCQILDG